MFFLEGRRFTLREIKEALLRTCSGYLNEAYFMAWDLDLWEIIELIEMAAEVNKPPSDRVDVYEAFVANRGMSTP